MTVAFVPSWSKATRSMKPSPSRTCLYRVPPRSKFAGEQRYSTPPRSDAGTTPSTGTIVGSASASAGSELYVASQSASR